MKGAGGGAGAGGGTRFHSETRNLVQVFFSLCVFGSSVSIASERKIRRTIGCTGCGVH